MNALPTCQSTASNKLPARQNIASNKLPAGNKLPVRQREVEMLTSKLVCDVQEVYALSPSPPSQKSCRQLQETTTDIHK